MTSRSAAYRSRSVADRHAACGGLEAPHRLVAVNFGAMTFRRLEVRADARLGSQKARLRFEISPLVVGNVERRKAPPDLAGVENFVRNSVGLRSRERVGEEIGDMHDRRPRAARDEQPAVRSEQRCTGFALEVAPQRMRANGERCVVGAFADRETRYARVAVRRAESMRGRVAIDAEGAVAALAEVMERRAAHRAQTENDRAVGLHRTWNVNVAPRVSARPAPPPAAASAPAPAVRMRPSGTG